MSNVDTKIEAIDYYDQFIQELLNFCTTFFKVNQASSISEKTFRILLNAIIISHFFTNKSKTEQFLTKSTAKTESTWYYYHYLAYLFKSSFPYFYKRKKANKLTQTDILAIEFFPNNIHGLLPLVEQVKKEQKVAFVASREKVNVALKEQNFDSIIRLENYFYCTPVCFFQFNLLLNKFIKQFSLQHPPLGKYLGIIKLTFREQLIKAFFMHRALKLLIQELNPKLFLLSGGHSIDSRIVISLAEDHQYRTIQFQHAGVYKKNPFGKYDKSDIYTAWGSYFANRLAQNTSKQAIITGSIKHEVLLKKYKDEVLILNQILIASSPPSGKYLNQKQYNEICRFYANMARQLPQKQFIYKIHPSEDLEEVKSIFKHCDCPQNLIISSEDTYKLIASSETVICITSTVAYEALLFDKQLVIVDAGYATNYPFINEVPVFKLDQVTALVKILEQPNLNSKLQTNKYFSHKLSAISNGKKLIDNYLQYV